ncbi:glycerol kinase [Candidatus Bathyarchaeota archaeon]|nr:glycerol kinase [Candidatus Bathyarchaeota archaeon]
MVQMTTGHILVIDSGGSNLRSIVFDTSGKIIGRARKATPPLTPVPGAVEHDPETLWTALLKTSKSAIQDAKITWKEIATIGICNQRASFLLWEEATGKAVTNLIGWADVRAADACDEMNALGKWKRLKIFAKIASKISRSTMLKAAAMMDFTTDHATVRLRWLLNENPEIRRRCNAGELKFGTLDSWFIHKITRGKVHATDYSNAGATGLFNPFKLEWNKTFLDMFDFHQSLFPEVRDTNGFFGRSDGELFDGQEIPIHGIAGDQQAALFGHQCIEPGDVKISQGSGAFVDMTVGPEPKLSKRGLFPLIAWRLNGTVTYMLEGYVATAGTLIDWLGQGIGLSDTPRVLNELASQASTTEGVIFVPTNSGIRYPYFNPNARGCIFGLSLSTHRRHVARAVLEGIALSLHEVLEGMEQDTGVEIRSLKVDGGVSKSDILLQALADISRKSVNRAPEPDMTATGVAYLAGLGAGIWESLEDLEALGGHYMSFEPIMEESKRDRKLKQWKKGIEAVLSMYAIKN